MNPKRILLALIATFIAITATNYLIHEVWRVIEAAVQPMPDGLLTRWIVSGMAQSVLVGVLLLFVYRPTKSCFDLRGK